MRKIVWICTLLQRAKGDRNQGCKSKVTNTTYTVAMIDIAYRALWIYSVAHVHLPFPPKNNRLHIRKCWLPPDHQHLTKIIKVEMARFRFGSARESVPFSWFPRGNRFQSVQIQGRAVSKRFGSTQEPEPNRGSRIPNVEKPITFFLSWSSPVPRKIPPFLRSMARCLYHDRTGKEAWAAAVSKRLRISIMAHNSTSFRKISHQLRRRYLYCGQVARNAA